jgi:hypothetical protein
MCEYVGHETNPCVRVVELEDQLVKCQQIKEDNLGIAERWQNRHDDLKAQLEQVKDWLRETRAGWSGSDSEFTEYYGDLAEIVGVEFFEEVEVEITISQTITVKKPIGTDLQVQDFWLQKDCELLDCNYEITQEESASVEDISE